MLMSTKTHRSSYALRCAKKEQRRASALFLFPILERRFFLLLPGAFAHPQQHKHQAHAQKDVADARHAGQRGVERGGERRAQYLHDPPRQQGEGGHVQARMKYRQDPADGPVGEAQLFFQRQQHQEQQRAQCKVMGMYHRQGGAAGKALDLGELPVKHTGRGGEQGIDKGCVGIAFHDDLLLKCNSG